MPTFAFTCGSLGDILTTAHLVAKICQILYDPSDASLKRELQRLHESLLRTHNVIQNVRSTDFSDTLVRAITQTITHCRSEMHHFVEQIDHFEKPLSFTNISNLWGRIWWATRQPHEVAKLRRSLSEYRHTIDTELAALNLCVSLFLK
jgi:hypothetical protein